MKKNVFVEAYKKKNASEEEINHAIENVLSLEKYLRRNGRELDFVSEEELQKYLDCLIESDENSMKNLLALARYYYSINNKDIYIYFTKLLGGIGVIENIKNRIVRYIDDETANQIFDEFMLPPIGTSPKEMPKFTKKLITRMKEIIPNDKLNVILAGNNHQIPVEAMNLEKEYFEKSNSLESYLIERHARKVQELQKCFDENRIWFEQIVSQDMVDYVASNQEILSAVIKENKLYVTKIPYETDAFLAANNDIDRRYHACHCPFVREAIKIGLDIDPEWCYCSAGFAKFPFESILNRELPVRVIESPLSGSHFCRFEIDIKEDKSEKSMNSD